MRKLVSHELVARSLSSVFRAAQGSVLSEAQKAFALVACFGPGGCGLRIWRKEMTIRCFWTECGQACWPHILFPGSSEWELIETMMHVEVPWIRIKHDVWWGGLKIDKPSAPSEIHKQGPSFPPQPAKTYWA